MTKAIIRVLDAVKSGCRTSDEVEAVIRIPRAEVSVWLGELLAMGLVTRRGKNQRVSKSEMGGGKFYIYDPVEGP